MQIITGIERRRRWQADEKLGIIAEAMQPGASVSEIARRHDMSRKRCGSDLYAARRRS
jgi:transposase-like protein